MISVYQILTKDLIKYGWPTFSGMVPFAIGSETAGSITYPAARCGVTALRPTFGTVGRSGVMSISESLVIFLILSCNPLDTIMLWIFLCYDVAISIPKEILSVWFVHQDKLGPFCRSAVDCAVILDIIRGRDPDDPSSKDMPFEDPFTVDITKLTVGYLVDAESDVSHYIALVYDAFLPDVQISNTCWKYMFQLLFICCLRLLMCSLPGVSKWFLLNYHTRFNQFKAF